MDYPFFLKGLLIGVSIAAPVGPIGVLCIRRSLNQGLLVGFITGLGAATADALYGAVAAFGLTLVSQTLVSIKSLLHLAGGAFLVYLGIKTFRRKLEVDEGSPPSARLLGAYIVTFFLTLTNPATIISFVAVFAGIGLGTVKGDYPSATLLTLGVFFGSAAWWLLLSSMISLMRFRATVRVKEIINQCSGVVLAGFGIYALTLAF